jgi:hypothetical protein
VLGGIFPSRHPSQRLYMRVRSCARIRKRLRAGSFERIRDGIIDMSRIGGLLHSCCDADLVLRYTPSSGLTGLTLSHCSTKTPCDKLEWRDYS